MSSNKGFTLIEVLVSLVIFLVIAVGVGFGLHQAVDNNVFNSQRQDVLNTTLALLDGHPPGAFCGTTQQATTPPGLAFTITVTCTPAAITVAPPSPNPQATVTVTQVTAVANWSTFGVARSVTVQE